MSDPMEDPMQQELGSLRILPPEIRLQIWKYSLPESADLDIALANTPENPSFKYKYIFAPPLEPPVYRLSKQIRKEALSIIEPTMIFNSLILELRHTVSAISRMSANVKPRIKSVRVEYNRSTKFEAWMLFQTCRDRLRPRPIPLQGVIFRCTKQNLAARIFSEEEAKFFYGQMTSPRRHCGDISIELPPVKVRYWQALAQLRKQIIRRFESEARKFEEQNDKKIYVSSQWVFEGEEECLAIMKLSLKPDHVLKWRAVAPQRAEPIELKITTHQEEMEFERTFRVRFIDRPNPVAS